MTVRGAATLFIAILAIDVAVFFGIELLGAPFIGIFLSVISIGAAAFFVTSALSAFYGAPFVPTDGFKMDGIVAAVGVKPGMHVVDLGSGDGRVLIAAAKAGAIAEGWEINPWLVLISKWKARRAGVADKVTVHFGSYWMDDMGHADAVFLFLIDSHLKAMGEKLRKELRPGTKVVSYVFRFPEWERLPESRDGIHVYVTPG